MNSSKKMISLIPIYQKCVKCRSFLTEHQEVIENIKFYCSSCEIYTLWSNGTKLHSSQIHYSLIEKLMMMFLDKKTPHDAFDILGYHFVDSKLNINTIRNYHLAHKVLTPPPLW